MKEKINKAISEMESKIKFDEKKHIYTTVDGNKSLQGVSSISNIMPMDWLSAWGAKECVKFLGYTDYDNIEYTTEMLEKIKLMDSNEYLKLLGQAKGACKRKSNKALADGRKGHLWLESYVKAKINGTELPKLPTDELLKRPLLQFCQWSFDNVDYWIASEAFVSYPEKGYAGQLDGVAMMKNSKLAIIDFKFAQHLSEDYYLQTAGYQAAFEPYGIEFDTRILIRLPKTLEKEEYDMKTYKYFMIPNNLEVMEVPTPYDIDRETFFASIWVKKWIHFVEKDF